MALGKAARAGQKAATAARRLERMAENESLVEAFDKACDAFSKKASVATAAAVGKAYRAAKDAGAKVKMPDAVIRFANGGR